MSAAILDRARAFALIAEHLTDEQRVEIAEALKTKLVAELGGTTAKPEGNLPQPEQPTPRAPDVHDETAAFLAGKGLTGAALAKAAGELTTWLAGDRFHSLSREARMQSWWSLFPAARTEMGQP